MSSPTQAMSPSTLESPARVLSAEEASRARREHEERADALTAAHRERRLRGQKHPVEDFLFTYYPFSPAKLRRWHPGWDVAYPVTADVDARGAALITDVDDAGHRSWYLDYLDPPPSGRPGAGRTDTADGTGGTAGHDGRLPHREADVLPRQEADVLLRRADVERYRRDRASALTFMRRLLSASSLSSRRPQFGCFGLHEWAMVHRVQEGEQRHEDLPLRLSQAETDQVVERENLVCSHIDAFRFFTPSAAPRNAMQPTRETQVELDNPACLHVGMDLYKWAMKLTPLIPSGLVLDCFEHARETRVLDMEASPYDVRPLGYGVVPIETASGKAEYVRRQRGLAERADALRSRILDHLPPAID
ncbi:3-methyladenine DNA glycosylase [Brachybacterium alimentarium]|uniref:3-methyladenine DNA glycosylase n=1 Tax=Brachybacterium alimentarium TaxID=47845 RepID=UPI003FD1B713